MYLSILENISLQENMTESILKSCLVPLTTRIHHEAVMDV